MDPVTTAGPETGAEDPPVETEEVADGGDVVSVTGKGAAEVEPVPELGVPWAGVGVGLPVAAAGMVGVVDSRETLAGDPDEDVELF